QHLAELVPAHVRKSGEPLTMAETRWGLRIAARVSVEVEEETELDQDPVDRSRAMPGAVPGAAAGLVGIDRIVGVGDRGTAGRLRHLLKHLEGRRCAQRRRARVAEVTYLGDLNLRGVHIPQPIVVLPVRGCVTRATDAGVKRVQTADLVA